ncbi:MAG TPA: methyltransferase domain-containing protein [Gemmatales bacterium]|nr:methyltransferase domain-containing protein [Gemmatales bacterium]
MGAWTSRQRISTSTSILAYAALTALLTVPFLRQFLAQVTPMLSRLNDYQIWEASGQGDSLVQNLSTICLGVVLTLVMLVLVWEIFVPLGRILGRLLDEHPRPIVAYSWNIAGSLVGILGFVLMSALGLQPYAWCIVVLLLFLPYLSDRRWLAALVLLAATGLSSLSSLYPDTVPKSHHEEHPVTAEKVELVWSPYQKLYLKKYTVHYPEGPYEYLDLEVNNSTYQTIHDARTAHYEQFPHRYGPKLRDLTQYDVPLLLKPAPARCMIVGAGSGNDVAGALRHGAKRVVAVEIDPFIIRMGKQYHPERPYDAPAVEVVNDDARAYFANARESFDLIIFGLLDSHTTAAMTNARLDHYVYTRESLERAKSLLAPGGLIVLSFYVERDFIGDRMNQQLREVFGHDPLAFRFPYSSYGRGGVIFVVGDTAQIASALAAQPRLADLIKECQQRFPLNFPGTTPVTTDDWPYVYLEDARIPSIFLLMGALMLLLFWYGLKRFQLPGLFSDWRVRHWHFFFLGAAFMLLEVQNISKAALALGCTWEVSAVIIASIMVIILLANWLVTVWPGVPLSATYACLVGSCLGLYFVDLSVFADLSYFPRAAVVGGLTCLPMLFSGIVFIKSFAPEPSKDAALGANLFGALVGGLLQSLTFLVGVKALLLIVAGLYVAALLSRPRPTVKTV